MKVTWTTTTIGTIHAIKSEDEVLEFVESLIKLGFTPEVTHE